jgi:hypothetical protein
VGHLRAAHRLRARRAHSAAADLGFRPALRPIRDARRAGGQGARRPVAGAARIPRIVLGQGDRLVARRPRGRHRPPRSSRSRSRAWLAPSARDPRDRQLDGSDARAHRPGPGRPVTGRRSRILEARRPSAHRRSPRSRHRGAGQPAVRALRAVGRAGRSARAPGGRRVHGAGGGTDADGRIAGGPPAGARRTRAPARRLVARWCCCSTSAEPPSRWTTTTRTSSPRYSWCWSSGAGRSPANRC